MSKYQSRGLNYTKYVLLYGLSQAKYKLQATILMIGHKIVFLS